MCRPPPSGPIFNSRSSVRAHFRRGRKRDRVGGKSRSDMLRAETPSPWMPRSRPDRGDVPGAKGEESTAPANTRNARCSRSRSICLARIRDASTAAGLFTYLPSDPFHREARDRAPDRSPLASLRATPGGVGQEESPLIDAVL
jgi:hypothetical protein